MAPSVAQLSDTHDVSRLTQARHQLAKLTICKVQPDRVCKPGSKNSAKAQRSQCIKLLPRPSRSAIEIMLRREQVEPVLSIYERLQSLPHLSKQIPHYNSQFLIKKIEYPNYRRWKVVNDFFELRWTREELHHIRDCLIDIVSDLYSVGLAYALDISRFTVMRKTKHEDGKHFVPFIDIFNLHRPADDRILPWETMKNHQIEIIRGHFDVLEILPEMLEHASESFPRFLQPRTRVSRSDILAYVIIHSRMPARMGNFAFRASTIYSTELGRAAMGFGLRRLHRIYPRAGPAEENSSLSIRDHSSALNHVLRLMYQYMEKRQAESIDLERSDKSDQAALLVIHAGLLIQLHAKVITAAGSQGLVDLNSIDTPDAYTSYEGFQVVADARSCAKKAVASLGQGDRLYSTVAACLRSVAYSQP